MPCQTLSGRARGQTMFGKFSQSPGAKLASKLLIFAFLQVGPRAGYRLRDTVVG